MYSLIMMERIWKRTSLQTMLLTIVIYLSKQEKITSAGKNMKEWNWYFYKIVNFYTIVFTVNLLLRQINSSLSPSASRGNRWDNTTPMLKGNTCQEDATLGTSNHFHTISKPLSSPVKKRPPGPNSINATSFLANKRPLSENLLKKHHQRMRQKNKKYYHDGGTVTKRNVNNLDLLTMAIHTCELNCLCTRKIILAFPLHQASQKVKQHPVI